MSAANFADTIVTAVAAASSSTPAPPPVPRKPRHPVYEERIDALQAQLAYDHARAIEYQRAYNFMSLPKHENCFTEDEMAVAAQYNNYYLDRAHRTRDTLQRVVDECDRLDAEAEGIISLSNIRSEFFDRFGVLLQEEGSADGGGEADGDGSANLLDHFTVINEACSHELDRMGLISEYKATTM